MSNLLEQLKQAQQLAEEVSCLEISERNAYIKDLAQIYYSFQQAVYGMIDEHGCILQNFNWERRKHHGISNELDLDKFIDKIATDFAYQYGFSKNVIKEILLSKNNFDSYYDVSKGWGGWVYQLQYYALVPRC